MEIKFFFLVYCNEILSHMTQQLLVLSYYFHDWISRENPFINSNITPPYEYLALIDNRNSCLTSGDIITSIFLQDFLVFRYKIPERAWQINERVLTSFWLKNYHELYILL